MPMSHPVWQPAAGDVEPAEIRAILSLVEGIAFSRREWRERRGAEPEPDAGD
jgi:hypothetical protein